MFDHELLFFSLDECKIIKSLSLQYNEVIPKIIKKKKKKIYESEEYISEFFDKVNPIQSKRSDEFFSLKSRKNTGNSESLHKSIIYSRKMESSNYSDSQFRRSVTDGGERKTRLTKFGSYFPKKRPSSKIKFKMNDTK